MSITETAFETLDHLEGLTVHLLQNNTSEELQTIPEPGKWTPLQIAAHIISYQQVFLTRMNQILHEDNPSFERYTPDTDSGFLACSGKNAETLISMHQQYRGNIKNFLRSLSPEQCERTGKHTAYGNLTIPLWLEFFMLHESHHIFKMFQILHKDEDH